MRVKYLGGILAVVMSTTLCHAQTPATAAVDEKSIWEVWKLQQEKPDEHGTISTNCLEFAKKSPKDPLAVVALTLAAWHMLKVDNREAAAKLLKITEPVKATDPDPLSAAAAGISKAWLTRTDMEHVKQALQLCYRKSVEYPKKIDAIIPFQKDGQPPLTDRWGKPWSYSLSEFQGLKKLGTLYGMYGQKYTIKSATLGTNSELKVALKIPYAQGIQLKPVKMLSGMPGKEMVQFETTDGKQTKVIMSIGADTSGVTLSYVGPKLLILSDVNHWLIVPRPL